MLMVMAMMEFKSGLKNTSATVMQWLSLQALMQLMTELTNPTYSWCLVSSWFGSWKLVSRGNGGIANPVTSFETSQYPVMCSLQPAKN